MTDYSVPFVSNTPDDMHCLQASYAMIRQYFDPRSEIDWDEWSALTGYVPEKGTWSMAGLMWFKDQGYEVIHISNFDYHEFSYKGTDYLVEALGEEVGKWESEFIPDLAAEKERALRFAETGIWIKRTPTLHDIYFCLDSGYLIKCLVNMHALNGREGYLGHAVVVKGYSDNELILHDPGLPARPNRRVPIDVFMKAWTNPTTHAEKMDAIKRISPMPVVSPLPEVFFTDSEPTATNDLVPA